MADIEDSGFGIESLNLVDNSIATLPAANTVINILSSIHPVFSSDGKDNKLVEMNNYSEVLTQYGTDFADLNKYGQQNLNAQQVLANGGTVYLCRLLPENAKTAHLAIKVGIKSVASIPLYKRDAYGNFVFDDEGNKIPVTVTKKVAGENGSPENEVQEPAHVSGIQFKIIVDSASEEDWTKYPTAKKLSRKFAAIPAAEDEEGYKIFPLEFIYYYANGKCGLNYGIRIINDFARDEKVDDGRRYQMYLVKKKSSGYEPLSIGNGISYAYNPEATVSKTVTTLEGLQKAYSNNDGTNEKQIQIDYYQDNYASLHDFIEEILSQEPVVTEGVDISTLRMPSSVEDVDFINGFAKDGYTFDNVVIDEDSVDLSVPVYLRGGSDGDFDTLTGEELAASKNSLLSKFFNADIDTANLLDVLRCDGAIIYDANYSMETKLAMTKLINYRRDICVVFDCGETDNILDAINISSQIKETISIGGENYAIVPHFGITTNRSVNVRVTGTYEFSGGITSLYKRSPFSIYAGKPNDNGAVKNMIFDWVVEETKPKGYYEKLAKNARLYYAIDLGKAVSTFASGNTTGRNVYFFSNNNLYSEKLSKLSEFRNGILVNDIRRILKLTLCKYTFDSEGASAAITKAREDLVKQFNNRYPSNVVISLSLYQTERDILLNQATCQVTVVFPDVFETWNCTIIASRNGTTEA